MRRLIAVLTIALFSIGAAEAARGRQPCSGKKGGGHLPLLGWSVCLQERDDQCIETDMRPMMRAAMVAVALVLTASVAHAQPAPVMQKSCADDENAPQCLDAWEKIPNEYKRARRGDYQAMRNVAFCMYTGCDGAVVIDQKGACVWRRAIIKHRSADRGDESNLLMCHRSGL